MQIRLAPIILNDELAGKLQDKYTQYNAAHPDEPLTMQEAAQMFLEYAINYLDVSAIQ